MTVRPAVSRRRVLHLLAAASAAPAAASALAACGLGGSGSAGNGSGTLSLAYLGDATQQAAFNALFDAFHKAHPNITIRPNGIAAKDWGTFATTIITQLAGGKKYDIIDVATEGQQLMSSKNVLEPLDPYIARDKKVVDAYYAGIAPQLLRWTKQYGSPDGKTYFIPGGYNTVVLYCNLEVFAKAKVELPASDWTWDEFRDAGERIKSRTGAYLVSTGDGSFPFGDIMPWLTTNGTSTLDADWSGSRLDSDAAVEAATYVKGLLDDGLAPALGGSFDAAAQLAKGKLACLGGGRYVNPDIRRLKLVDRVRIVDWPHKRRRGTPVGWDGFPILKSSDNKEAAWTFIKWLMTDQASRFYATTGGTNIPALRSVAASSSFTSGAPKGAELLPRAIAFGTPIPSPVGGAAVQQAITTGWRNAITGVRPVRDALSAANAQIQPLL